jgi:glycosyltransferase involved in cell wall biosynthesis
MRIGIDTFSFDRPGTNFGVGPGVYVWRLLPELFAAGRQHRFVVFANRDNREFVPQLANVTVIVSRLSNRARPLRILHEQLELPYQFRKYRLDCIHLLGNNIAFALASKSVLTVHDLMWKYYSDLLGDMSLKNRYFALTVPASLRRAKALITVSQFVARQIQEAFNVPAGALYPILEASGGLSHPSGDMAARFQENYGFPFLFTVTTSWPHKNLQVLLEAFRRLKRTGTFPGKLIVAGQMKGSQHKATLDFIAGHGMGGHIILTGFISEEEKAYCYRHALVFVYPSLYEGFGLPILEAMEAGTPVVASSAASLPEVGGDACIYFDPASPVELAERLEELLANDRRRHELRERGLRRFKQFSWRRTAEETLRVYEECFQAREASIRADGLVGSL